jgi:hypothetical protein
MAENTKRSVFGFDGLFGLIISIFGLLSIVVALMLMVIAVQRNAQVDPYDPAPIRNIHNLKMISVDNKQFAFVSPKTKDTK